ncbi:hypothetical protein H4R33_004774 [Dimargaris cristalligena]|nr:hypothetical protein H4R33_004774 [Dimargaris cristalligena]
MRLSLTIQRAWSMANSRVVGPAQQSVRWLSGSSVPNSAQPTSESATEASSTKQPETFPPTAVAVPTDRTGEVRYPTILDQVQREAIRRSHNGTRARLFLRRPMDRTRTMQAGDVVMVETLNSKTSNTSTKFIGLCLGVFRRGVDTSFTLRNIVMKLGVEINFKGYSPMIKDIKILEKGSGYNRAKLFYIRKQPEKAFMFNNRKEMRVSNK